MNDADAHLREEVRAHYARAASAMTGADGPTTLTLVDADQCCSHSTGAHASCCGPHREVAPAFGAAHYSATQRAQLPVEAVAASLGCGNPMLVAELRHGEKVLDLGSGAGIDALLSARRVGDSGFVYGVDMTDEMLDLARSNAATAGVQNVEFRKGVIEKLPLPDSSVDVIISNCVVNLSTDKAAVLSEMYRVLRPGGRIGISDVVAQDHLAPPDRADRGSFAECFAGALSRREYLEGLTVAGFVDPEVTFTHEVADGMHGALIRAEKPEDGSTKP